jgi:L-asparaginase / beta-aspartyl-peptidase
MIKVHFLLAAALLLAGCASTPAPSAPPAWSIAVHGGAGVISRAQMTPEREAAYRTAMAGATARGADVLAKGGTAMDAVEAVARVLEDDPLFNAGRGAAIGADGTVTLDAAIMDGATLKAGAVAGVTTTRNPITLARAVMERTRHVFLIGEGADTFAREQGLPQVPNTYFITARRWGILEEVLTEDKLPFPLRPPGLTDGPIGPIAQAGGAEARFGTIGVVARDSAGRLAAATSTGGLTGKRWGRVGDAPVIGAGTYADQSCAVSATGTGEFFLRLVVAHSICTEAAKPGVRLQAAADRVIKGRLTAIQGDGGVIAMNAAGEAVWSLNTEGMYRAKASAAAPTPRVFIFADEEGGAGMQSAARPH